MRISGKSKKTILILTAVLIQQGLNLAYSQETNQPKRIPQIRGMDMESVSMKDYSDVVDNYSKNIQSSLKVDNIKTDEENNNQFLSGVVGKSKFIRFDTPVKRISIANPDLADLILLSPKEMLINGKQAGNTSLIIWGDSQDPVFFELQVQNDTKAFLKAVKTLVPSEKIDISFKEANAILSGKISSNIIKDKIKNLAKAYGFEAVDLAESPSNQVLLEVKIVEASKGFQKILSSTFQNGNWGIIPSVIDITSPRNSSSGIQNSLSSMIFDGTMNGFTFYRNIPKSDLSYFFKSAQQKGMAKILAEPQIVAANEQEASFNAGQQVPIPSGLSQTGQVSYSYKDIGVIVKFKPTILQNLKRVSMTISPEVSEIDSSASVQNKDGSTAATGFKTRKVSTTVELGDGETLVIAGLYKRTNNDTRTQVPILGDIPIIGTFFRNKSVLKDETELMIFVTPRLLDNNTESRI